MWVGKDGYPLSWRHFIVGMRDLSKSRSQHMLDMFRSFGATQAKAEDVKAWVTEQEHLAGH